MKQGNKSADRMEKGWERMQPILDKEFSPKKKKRVGFWIFAFAGFLCLTVGYYALQDDQGATTPIAINDNIINEDKSKSETKETSVTTAKENNLKYESGNTSTEASKASLANDKVKAITNNKVKPKKKNRKASTTILKTTKSTPIIAAEPVSHPAIPQNEVAIQNKKNNNENLAATSLSKKSKTPRALSQTTTTTTTTPAEEKELLHPAMPIASLSAPLSRSERAKPNNNYLSTNIIKAANAEKTASHILSAYSSAFITPNLEGIGAELGLAYSRQFNKVRFITSAGAGKHFSDTMLESYSSSKNDADFDNVTINNPSAAEGTAGTNQTSEDDNAFGVNQDGVRTALDRNEPIFRSTEWKADLSYLKGALGIGIELTSRFQLTSMIGLEYYRMTLYRVTTLSNAPNGSSDISISHTPTYYYYKPYAELIAGYELCHRLNVRLGYRKALGSPILLEGHTTNTDKILLGLNYNF